MRTISFIVASLCVGLVAAQQKDPGAVRANNEAINKHLDDLIKKGGVDRDKDWKASTLSLTELTARVARMTSQPKGVYGFYQMLAQTSEGRGVYTGEMKFQQPNIFKVNWVLIKPDPLNGTYVANGKTRQLFFDGQLRPPTAVSKPFSSATTDPAQLVSRFSNEFPRFLFQGATDGKDAWTPLINAWSKGAGGYKLTLQERSMVFQNRTFRSFRIKLVRNATAAKKLGESTVEIIFDGVRYLPITVREIRRDLNKKPWVVQWSGNYKFNQTFKSDDFLMKSVVSKANP